MPVFVPELLKMKYNSIKADPGVIDPWVKSMLKVRFLFHPATREGPSAEMEFSPTAAELANR